MNRVLARAAAITGTALTALALAATAASADEGADRCSDIAVCAGHVVTVGDVDVSVLDDVNLLHTHH